MTSTSQNGKSASQTPRSATYAGVQEREKENSLNRTDDVDTSNGDEEPRRRKRQRVSQACDQCRRSKYRCDGIRPVCSTCVETNRDCSYGAQTKRRGLQTGYVRAIEALWGLVFKRIDGSEETVRRLLDPKAEGNDNIPGLRGENTELLESMIDRWKKSKIPVELDKLLSAESEMSDGVTAGIGNGEQEYQGWVLPSQSSTKAQLHTQTQVCQALEKGVLSLDVINNVLLPTTEPFDHIRRSLNCALRLPTTFRGMLDHYFTYTHCWLPVVEKHDVFRICYAYGSGGVSVPECSTESGNHAVLWAILAHSSLQMALHYTPDPGQTCQDLYLVARKLIPRETEATYTAGHVQALLILGLYQFATGDWTASWLLVGQAALIAKDIGIYNHCEVGGQRNFSDAKIWMGCFALDTILSMRLKRVPQLARRDVKQLLPLEESGLDEWEPWRDNSKPNIAKGHTLESTFPTHAVSTFNHFIRLLCIFNDHLRGNMAQTPILEWMQDLPDHCRPTFADDFTLLPDHLFMPHIMNLRLLYNVSFLLTNMQYDSHAMFSRNQRDNAIISSVKILQRYSRIFGVAAVPGIFELYTSFLVPQAVEVSFSDPSSTETLSEVLVEFETTLPVIHKAKDAKGRAYNLPNHSRNDFDIRTSVNISSTLPRPYAGMLDEASFSCNAQSLSSLEPRGSFQSVHTVNALPMKNAAPGTTQLFQRRLNSSQGQMSPPNALAGVNTSSPFGSSTTFTALSMPVGDAFSGSDGQSSTLSALHNIAYYETSPFQDNNSLFDYFASLDVPASRGDQSQFMMNLGYSEDALPENYLPFGNSLDPP